MDNFFTLLREAFNESANYFAWAFYSILTAYISVALFSLAKNKKQNPSWFSKIIFVIYGLIITLNLFFIFEIFKSKFGIIGGGIFVSMVFFMLIINAGPAVYSIMQQHKKMMSKYF